MFENLARVLRNATNETVVPTAPPISSPLNAERMPISGVPELRTLEQVAPESPEAAVTASLLKAAPVLVPLLVVALPVLFGRHPLPYLLFGVIATVVFPRFVRLLRGSSSSSSLVSLGITLLAFGILARTLLDVTLLASVGLFFVLCVLGQVPLDIALVHSTWLRIDSKLAKPIVPWHALWDIVLLSVPFFVGLVLLLRLVPVAAAFNQAFFVGSLVVLALIPVINGTLSPLSMRGLVWPYLFYDGRQAESPNIWKPGMVIQERRLRFLFYVVLLYAYVAVSLQLLLPAAPGSELDLRTFGTAMEFFSHRSFEEIAQRSGDASLEQLPFSNQFSELDLTAVGSRIVAELLNAVWISARVGVVAFAGLYLVTLPIRISLAWSWRRCDTQRQNSNEWETCVRTIRASEVVFTDPLGGTFGERDHLFLGHETTVGFPVLLHKPLLREHVYIVGDSGSGKTTLGITPLVMQLIREEEDPHPIVVLDLKGDPALFQTVRMEAEARNRDFRFFRTDRGATTFRFDPLQNLASQGQSEMQMCQLLLDALSLNHGEGYGRSYYSRRSRGLLIAAMEERPRPTSLVELSQRLKAYSLKPREAAEAFELVSTIELLARYPALGPGKPESTIHMPSVLEKRQVVYFWLPAAVESMSVREIGKMALYSLLTAAIERQNEGADPRQAYLFIDEFQRIAGENFKIILEQARSFGIGAILANQSMEDLRLPSADLRATVYANTRVKMYFSASHPNEVEALARAFGEVPQIQRSWALGATAEEQVQRLYSSHTESFAEVLRPRRTTTDIRRMSDHPLQMLLHVSRGSGLTQFAGLPITVRVAYPITKKEYERRLALGTPGAGGWDNQPLTSPQLDEEDQQNGPDYRDPLDDAPSSVPEPESATEDAEGLTRNTVGPEDLERVANVKFFSRLRANDPRGTDAPDSTAAQD